MEMVNSLMDLFAWLIFEKLRGVLISHTYIGSGIFKKEQLFPYKVVATETEIMV